MNRTAYIRLEGQTYYRSNKKRIWVVGIAFLFLLVLLSTSLFTKTVTAQRNGERMKLVKSIEVQKGDTLWSIASANISDEYDDVNTYIEEIKISNGITSDEIHAGNYIIIPYYTDGTYE